MEREEFLDGIARRLGRPRVRTRPARAVRGVPDFHRQAPFGPGAATDLAERFKEELLAVGGEAVLARDLLDVHAALKQALLRWRAERVVTWARPELAAFTLDWLWKQSARAYGDAGLDTGELLERALLDADVGITAVDFAIAGTGSLVVTAGPGRPRGVSLLPTLHVALVKESQLVARMGEALALIGERKAGSMPSAVHFITGPSRTSDIENDLTIGVHGPAAVTAIVWRGA